MGGRGDGGRERGREREGEGGRERERESRLRKLHPNTHTHTDRQTRDVFSRREKRCDVVTFKSRTGTLRLANLIQRRRGGT